MSDVIRAETAALLARFEARGAQRVEADILQPAETLLDLYGENIRARAYVTQDALRGEQMLRPDFTVPVVEMHMASGATAASYTYAGPVFRRQESDESRASEYPQVGYEIFDGRAGAEDQEADLFAAFYGALAGLPLRAVTGDMAILRAAVSGLETSAGRRAALMRHLWRPRRFRALLDRFSAPIPLTADPLSGPEIGLRSAREVAERRARIEADRAAPVIDGAAREALEDLLEISAPLPDALKALVEMAKRLPTIALPLERLMARVDALMARDVVPTELDFEVSYGRTSMEYYDGFVFGFTAPGLAPVATGGRYDALTKVLGQGRSVSALGGVIRPDLVAQVRARKC
ncbi:MAG: ATP phosphoribosyltransferase regulatory subunit [Pseudomonadota bacterium]